MKVPCPSCLSPIVETEKSCPFCKTKLKAFVVSPAPPVKKLDFPKLVKKLNRKYKVLSIEDDRVFSKFLKLSLENNNYDVVTIDNGSDGFKVAKEFQPDLILLDINLPTISGFDTAKLIRKEASIADTPIVVVTSLTQDINRNRCYELGVNYYLTKPVRIEELYNIIAEQLKQVV